MGCSCLSVSPILVYLQFWLQASYSPPPPSYSLSPLLLNPLSLGHFIHSLGFNYPYMMVTLTFIARTSSLFRAWGSYIQLANGHFHRGVLQNSAFPSLIAPIVFPSKPVSLSLVPCIGDWYPCVSQGFPPLKENVLKVCLLFTTVAPLLSIPISQVLLRHSSNWSHWLPCSSSPLILHSAARRLFMISLLLPRPPSFTAAPRTLPPAKVSFQCLLLFPGLHRHCSFTWNSFSATLTHFAILSPSSPLGLSLVILSSRK